MQFWVFGKKRTQRILMSAECFKTEVLLYKLMLNRVTDYTYIIKASTLTVINGYT